MNIQPISLAFKKKYQSVLWCNFPEAWEWLVTWQMFVPLASYFWSLRWNTMEILTDRYIYMIYISIRRHLSLSIAWLMWPIGWVLIVPVLLLCCFASFIYKSVTLCSLEVHFAFHLLHWKWKVWVHCIVGCSNCVLFIRKCCRSSCLSLMDFNGIY